MSKVRSIVMVALVCINVALVASLVLVASAPPAKAQPIIGARTDYLVATGRVSENNAVVYVLDIRKQALAVWTVEKTNKKFVTLAGRSIQSDFGKPRTR